MQGKRSVQADAWAAAACFPGWIACVMLMAFSPAGRGAEPFPEYKVKAAFLFNFARFVKWPENAFVPERPIVIGVVGADPFGATLDETFRDKSFQGRSAQVIRLKRDDDLRQAHILFIAQSEKERLREILAKVANRPVLTVSELDDFIKEGGMIRFRIVDQQVGFDLNQKATKEVGLIPHLQMIKIAKTVLD